jgi:hypothetical protein
MLQFVEDTQVINEMKDQAALNKKSCNDKKNYFKQIISLDHSII